MHTHTLSHTTPLFPQADRWEDAYKIAVNCMPKEEIQQLYVSRARELVEQGKLREAEKLYVIVDEPDLAISMYKKHKQVGHSLEKHLGPQGLNVMRLIDSAVLMLHFFLSSMIQWFGWWLLTMKISSLTPTSTWPRYAECIREECVQRHVHIAIG